MDTGLSGIRRFLEEIGRRFHPFFDIALRNDAEDKERILRALKQANGNRSVAAELLGIGRTTLYSKLEEYGLKSIVS